MTPFKHKYNKAVKELNTSKYSRPSIYRPDYIFIILKAVGLNIKPPFYATYRENFIIISVFYICFSVIATQIIGWSYEDIPFIFIFFSVIIAPILYAHFTAKFYEKKRAHLRISNWKDL